MSVKLEVTKEAQSQVQALIKAQKPGIAVRVYLQPGGGGGCGCGSGGGGGGCGSGGCGSGGSSAPSFGMAFDKPRNGDEVIPVDGFNVIVDGASAEFIDGAKIDYVTGLDESGFKITSPLMAERPASGGGGGCGCGSGGGGCC
ncbi:MAG TPA: iron-sulfur cluster biosynthesis family protein [Thermoplasmata archaeon]|nr:iron-sulfur cluster biosynthesis family protein [Thermoplasmata archaeon]